MNNHWLDNYHIDGFRYDYVPGYWLEDSENGYTKLVKDTYQLVKEKKVLPITGNDFFNGDSINLIQCAEQLQKPVEILNETCSSCTWQNETLNVASGVAGNPGKLTDLGFFWALRLSGRSSEQR